MTKIQVTDGKKPAKKPAAKKSAAKKPAKKIAVKKVTTKKITVKKAPAKKPVAKKKAPAKKKTIAVRHISSANAVTSTATHSSVQKSTTLSRRYVKKPVSKITIAAPKPAPKIEAKPEPAKIEPKPEPAKVAAPEPLPKIEAKPEPVKIEAKPESAKIETKPVAKIEAKPVARIEAKSSMPKLASKQDKALKSAIRSVATMNEPKDDVMPKKFKKKHKARRVVLALFCSGLTVAGLFAFVHFNMPDVSVRVAALQTGIEATYPTFVPRNYSLSNVSSDRDGEIVMYFTGEGDNAFSLSEENSTWDSTALLNNYVKKVYPSDFTTLREQGITIYIRGDQASWVNGGILYKIESTGKVLTKEQIRNIATSL